MFMALDAIALKLALAKWVEEFLCCGGCSSDGLKASIYSSLCSLTANAASSSWTAKSSLLCTLFLASSFTLLVNIPEGRIPLFLKFWLLRLLAELSSSVPKSSFKGQTLWFLLRVAKLLPLGSWLSTVPDNFLDSTSFGNKSCIVFQRTVLTVQDLPLLQNSGPRILDYITVTS